MLRIIIFFVVGLAFCAELYAQDNPNIVSMIYFKPKAGQKEQYLAGLKEHTEKHHNKGVARVRTYRIISGLKSGGNRSGPWQGRKPGGGVGWS